MHLADPERMGDGTVMGVEDPGVIRCIGSADLSVILFYTEVLTS